MSRYSSYILFLLISVFVVILYVNDFGPLGTLQQSIDDFLIRATTPDGTRPNIAVVTIDGPSQDVHGSWPWNYDLIADLLAATAIAEPKAMLVELDLGESAAQDSAGYTAILAGQLSWMDNVVLPFDIALATYRSNKTNNPDYLFNNSLVVNNPLGLMDEESSLLARKVFLPAQKLLEAQPRLGFNYTMPDEDHTLRHQALTVFHEGYYYPSVSLIAAAAYLGVPTNDIEVIEGVQILLGGKRQIPINDHGEYLVTSLSTNSFVTFSASDVLSEDFDRNQLKGKFVLIAVNDPFITETFRTNIEEATPRYIVKASVIENIINQNMLTVRNGQAGVDMIILFLLGGIFAFFLPQISRLYRLVVLLGALIIVANFNFFMVSSFHIIVATVYLYLELFLFIFAAFMLDSSLLSGEKEATSVKSSSRKLPKVEVAKKSPAESAPSAVEPDEIPVRTISTGDGDQNEIETKALGFDEDPFDHQAINIDGQMDGTAATPDTGDADESRTTGFDSDNLKSLYEEPISAEGGRAEEPQCEIDQPVASGPPAGEPETRIPVDSNGVTMDSNGMMVDSNGAPLSMHGGNLKNLGRYQVTGVVGKGAMGLVYKGIDPAINRPVALKTIRLDFVNDPEEMAELKERLSREAQAAGKMSHPNIVTIYDFGSEGHLQYIAMEYLEGQTLEDVIKKKAKINYRILSQIVMQICSALEYAHDQGIVHRDIKPANIMILKDYRVKVMDYGIARVDSTSMTKTGIAMGTPNYISPEQLRGQPTDRRADLFSLGVVMYELLLGKRPFKGENITSLIYAILNHEPQKPSNVNPQIPLLFDHIITKALKKNPKERYQKASEVMADMADFVEAFAPRR